MHWLVEGAEPGDTPFFYCGSPYSPACSVTNVNNNLVSGRAVRLKDAHENEPNRLHEGMCVSL